MSKHRFTHDHVKMRVNALKNASWSHMPTYVCIKILGGERREETASSSFDSFATGLGLCKYKKDIRLRYPRQGSIVLSTSRLCNKKKKRNSVGHHIYMLVPALYWRPLKMHIPPHAGISLARPSPCAPPARRSAPPRSCASARQSPCRRTQPRPSHPMHPPPALG